MAEKKGAVAHGSQQLIPDDCAKELFKLVERVDATAARLGDLDKKRSAAATEHKQAVADHLDATRRLKDGGGPLFDEDKKDRAAGKPKATKGKTPSAGPPF